MSADNYIDDLKLQVNIVDVIGKEVSLKKSGSNYMGLCPFHSEKTASFSVNEEKQFYHCFGCGKSGDVIRFVQEYYKLPFMDAVEKLAGDYGIRLPERRTAGPKIDYDKYYSINAKAARYYYNCLGVKNNPGLAYLRKRGLSSETITKFGLGYAPAGWTALTDHLRSEGVSDEDMIRLGLAVNGKNGIYDKFRDRVMFPIINTQDKVIGFGGRAIGDVKPKYLNSPESEVFLKKNNLFALNFARKEISAEDRAIMVEGYMDVISLYQSGIKNAAASLGTALTENQARLLCRYSKNIILSYDSDQAGINAALRGIGVINAAGGKPRVMIVTDGKDPDEFVQKHGKEAFLKLADNAVPATDFRLRLAGNGYDFRNDRDVLAYIDSVVPILKSLGPVEQDMYIRRLSSEFGVSQHAIQMAVATDNKDRRRRARNVTKPAEGRLRSRQSAERQDSSIETRIEMSFAVLAVNNTKYIDRLRQDGIVFKSALAVKVISAAEQAAQTAGIGMHCADPAEISKSLDPEDELVFMKYMKTIQIGPDDEVFYRETKTSYLLNRYKMEKSEILNELAVAEKNGLQDEIKKLGDRLIHLEESINHTMEESNA